MTTVFRIDRSRWVCGDRSKHSPKYGTPSGYGSGNGYSALRNRYGCQCCLGFIWDQCHPNYPCKDQAEPYDQYKSLRLEVEVEPDNVLLEANRHSEIGASHTDFTSMAIDINDDATISNFVREIRLERLAEEFGLRIEFYGKYPNE